MAGGGAFGLIGLDDGRQAKALRRIDAVEAGDGKLAGDIDASFARIGHHAQRHGVGGAQDCGEVRVGVEKQLRGRPRGLRIIDVLGDHGHGFRRDPRLRKDVHGAHDTGVLHVHIGLLQLLP